MNTNIRLSTLRAEFDIAKVAWNTIKSEKKKDGRFSDAKILAKSNYDRLKKDIEKEERLAEIADTQPGDLARALSHGPEFAPGQKSAPENPIGAMSLSTSLATSGFENMNITHSPNEDGPILPERMDIDALQTSLKSLESSGLAHQDGTWNGNAEGAGPDEDADGDVDMDLDVEPKRKANTDDKAAANEDSNKIDASSGANMDEAANSREPELNSGGETFTRCISPGPSDGDVNLDLLTVTIPFPEDLDMFSFEYRHIDWTKYPPLKVMEAWSPKSRQIRLKLYKAQQELSYATQQLQQLEAHLKKSHEDVDKGALKALVAMRFWEKINPAIKQAASLVKEYSSQVEAFKRQVEELQLKAERTELLPSIKLRIQELTDKLYVAPDDKVVEIRSQIIAARTEMADLEERARKASSNEPGKKRKRAKVEPTEDPAAKLALIAGSVKLYQIDEHDEHEGDKTAGGGGSKLDPKPVAADVTKKPTAGEVPAEHYWKISDAAREKLQRQANAILTEYLAAKEGTAHRTAILARFGPSIRRAAREIWEFFPESSRVDLDLALAMHTTSANNTTCRYHHHFRNRPDPDHDTLKFKPSKDAPPEPRFFGIGFPKHLSSPGLIVKPEVGHMNCGCSNKEAMFEFYLWKNSFAKSSNPDLKDWKFYMTDDDIPTPIIRSFWVQSITMFSGLCLDDLYTARKETKKWRVKLIGLSISQQRTRMGKQGFNLIIDQEDETKKQELKKIMGQVDGKKVGQKEVIGDWD